MVLKLVFYQMPAFHDVFESASRTLQMTRVSFAQVAHWGRTANMQSRIGHVITKLAKHITFKHAVSQHTVFYYVFVHIVGSIHGKAPELMITL